MVIYEKLQLLKILCGMKKEKIIMEFPLDSTSKSLLWRMIGTPMGLSVWFSDGVTVDGNEYVFSWKGHEQSAYLIDEVEGKSITFRWKEDEGMDVFFKFEIVVGTYSGKLSLIITDFVEQGEQEDTELLWGRHVEDLRIRTGMTL